MLKLKIVYNKLVIISLPFTRKKPRANKEAIVIVINANSINEWHIKLVCLIGSIK